MPVIELVGRAQQALVLSVALVLPVVAIAAAIGFLVALFQAATQLQDVALAHLPRLVAVTVALLLFGPWMGRQIAAFAEAAFGAH